MSMEVTSFYEPESSTWTYLLADTSSGKALIIDPVWVYNPISGNTDTAFTDEILGIANSRGYSIEWVLETHTHADHLSSACYIGDKTGARIAIGKGICDVQKTFVKMYKLDDVPVDGSQFNRLLNDGDIVQLGNLEIRVMETPGHTSDSITYLCENAAFIGDTLFAPDFGTARCDFPGGDAERLFDSIARIHALPEETLLYLCHDYPADGAAPVNIVTVAESLAGNIHAKAGTDRDEYIEMRNARDAKLSLPELIYPAIQINIRAGNAPLADTNGASYLKASFNAELALLLKNGSDE